MENYTPNPHHHSSTRSFKFTSLPRFRVLLGSICHIATTQVIRHQRRRNWSHTTANSKRSLCLKRQRGRSDSNKVRRPSIKMNAMIHKVRGYFVLWSELLVFQKKCWILCDSENDSLLYIHPVAKFKHQTLPDISNNAVYSPLPQNLCISGYW